MRVVDGRNAAGNDVAVQPRDFSDQTAREVDLAIRQLIDDNYQRARELLSARRQILEQGVKMLLERETITPDDFPPLLPAPEPSPEPSPELAAQPSASRLPGPDPTGSADMTRT